MKPTFDPQDDGSRFSCPSCNHIFHLSGTFSNSSIRCPECQETIELPVPVAAAPVLPKPLPGTETPRKDTRIVWIVVLSTGAFLIAALVVVAVVVGPVIMAIFQAIDDLELP